VLPVALAGLVLGWLLGRVRWIRGGPPGHPDLAQLLRWIDAAPGGWLILDPLNTIRRINLRAERLLQIPAGTLLERAPLAAVHPGSELRELAETARRRRQPQRLEWDLGEQELELFALPGEAGWVALVLLSRRSLEAQLEQQERWVSDVAHELKTPLTALLLVGDSLADHASGRNAVLVGRLQRELLRLQELVRDLLELSRLENPLPAEVRRAGPVTLAPLVEQVWMGLRPLAEPRGIDLALQEDSPPAHPARVRGDAARLHRALLNLLENALRHSPDGGTVRVRIEAGPAWCLLSVRDQGPGLSEEDLEHMFERFYRGDPSRVRSPGGGSGLGLAIVQQIAATHGGRVQASNHPEGGAQLELVLPVGG
jgi:two-component system, OmpR family, phosphate regulon sensor histidine kinase PhoR